MMKIRHSLGLQKIVGALESLKLRISLLALESLFDILPAYLDNLAFATAKKKKRISLWLP